MTAPEPFQVGSDLAYAVVTSSRAPALLLDGDRRVVAVSDAFCQAFEIVRASAIGRDFASLGRGEWAAPQLQSLLNATAAGFAEVRDYEFDLKRTERSLRQLVVNAHKLDYGVGREIRVMLAIADVTDARLAQKMHEDLLHDKSIMLQELQHRVANSLQIIASVLLQSARRVQSDEARSHLNDAHNRVMSVAAIQKQLAISSTDRVSLGPYLSQLCESIGASMIPVDDQISLEVRSDDCRVAANISVSIGLVVTELVINALKHAFPDKGPGTILVRYDLTDRGWILSVADNGVGMPELPVMAKAGLGTSIVQALAHQLDARVILSDAKPGTKVWIEHHEAASEAAPVLAI